MHAGPAPRPPPGLTQLLRPQPERGRGSEQQREQQRGGGPRPPGGAHGSGSRLGVQGTTSPLPSCSFLSSSSFASSSSSTLGRLRGQPAFPRREAAAPQHPSPPAGVSAEAEKGPSGAASGTEPRRWPGCSAAASRLPSLELGVEKGNGRKGSATVPIGLQRGVSPPPAVDRGAGSAPPPPPLRFPGAASPTHRCSGDAAPGPGESGPLKPAQPCTSPASPRSRQTIHMHTQIYMHTRTHTCIFLSKQGYFAVCRLVPRLPQGEGARGGCGLPKRERTRVGPADSSGAGGCAGGRGKRERRAPAVELGSCWGFPLL